DDPGRQRLVLVRERGAQPRLGQRRPALAPRRARQRVRGRRHLPPAPALSMRPVRVGYSGWQYDSWRGPLYPEGLAKGRWLERYSQVFDTVEVNSTFYRLASSDAVARWVEQTPPGFTFAAKASRYLTHVKRLQGLAEGIGRYYEGI